MKRKRLLYIDIIKIVAMFLVIFLHSAATAFRVVPVDSMNFTIYNFYDAISRGCVALFVMASGAYFLNNKNKLDIKKIYKKHIFKIVIALILSSVIIETIKYILDPSSLTSSEFIINIIKGDLVLWFFYMLIGLYVLTPILRQITKSKELTLYLIILSFIFSVFIPTINHILEFDFLKKTLFQVFFGLFDVGSGYYVLIYYLIGYYLSEYEINNKLKRTIYFLGIIGVFATFLLTQYYSIKAGSADTYFYNYLSLSVFFTPLAIFLFLKSKFSDKDNDKKFLLMVSTNTLIIYPVHRMLMIVFSHLGVADIIITFPIVSIPVYSVTVFSLSTILSLIIKRCSAELEEKKVLRYLLYFIILFLIFFI